MHIRTLKSAIEKMGWYCHMIFHPFTKYLWKDIILFR